MRAFFFALAPLLLAACGDAVARGFADDETKPVVHQDSAKTPALTPASVDPSLPSYQVSGTVTGLAAGRVLVLENNGGDDLTFVASGPFTFPAPLLAGAPFAVTVQTQPAGETCAVDHASLFDEVGVHCTENPYAVGGTVSGLHGTVILSLGDQDLSIFQDGTFAFAPVASGTTYAIRLKSQPAGQQCVVREDTKLGSVDAAPVTRVVVGCTDFANADFGQGFAGWTLTRDAVRDDYAAAVMVAAGTTLGLNDVVHDAVSNADVTLTYDTPALPVTLTSASHEVGLLCIANGPSSLVATQDLALSSAVTHLSFGFQYASGTAPNDDTGQLVRVTLVDPTTSTELATLATVGTGADNTSSRHVITSDVSAYAGQTVRLSLSIQGASRPLYVGFDSFTLQ